MKESQFGQWWRSFWSGTFGMSRISRPGEGAVTSDTIVMQAATATSPEVPLTLARVEQFGDLRIPPPECPAPYLTLGAGGIVWSGGTPQRPTDGKVGDRGLYCTQAGARFHLYGDKSATPGRIRIDSATAAATPESVVVNGGTNKVATVTDKARAKIRVSWLQTTMATFTMNLSVVSPDGLTVTTIASFTAAGSVAVPATPGVPIPRLLARFIPEESTSLADLQLQRLDSGRYDFVLTAGGDLALTEDPYPAILRLLIQDPWIGDDGERAGQSLGAVKLITSNTRAQIQRIAETRLAALVRSGQLTAVQVLEVVTDGGRAFAKIAVQVPGQQPRTVQVPLG